MWFKILPAILLVGSVEAQGTCGLRRPSELGRFQYEKRAADVWGYFGPLCSLSACIPTLFVNNWDETTWKDYVADVDRCLAASGPECLWKIRLYWNMGAPDCDQSKGPLYSTIEHLGWWVDLDHLYIQDYELSGGWETQTFTTFSHQTECDSIVSEGDTRVADGEYRTKFQNTSGCYKWVAKVTEDSWRPRYRRLRESFQPFGTFQPKFHNGTYYSHGPQLLIQNYPPDSYTKRMKYCNPKPLSATMSAEDLLGPPSKRGRVPLSRSL